MCVCVISNQSTRVPVKRAVGVEIWGVGGGSGSKLGRNLRKGVGNIGGGRVFIK